MNIKTFTLAFSLLLTGPVSAHSQEFRTQLAEAQQITKSWMAKKAQGLVKRDIYAGNPEKSDLIISGIPKYLKQVNPSGVVYRHYTGSATDIIVQTGQLKTGITPYVIINPGFSREVYEDLVGIFLTTPQTPPEKVGLPRNPNADYVDFTLYPGTPVVEIEKEILLIPGRPDAPKWLKELYFDYKQTGRYDARYLDTFRKFDERGGVTPTFMKIKIQSYRKNGKVYRRF